MNTIIHVLSIGAPRSVAYAAITTSSGLSSWWSTRVEGSGERGGELRFTFHGEFHPVMQVTEARDDTRVEWRCTSGHPPWKDSVFSFALEEVDGATRLTFVQEYAEEPSDTQYGTYNFNWGYYLNSLKQYCESGRGTPFEPD